MLGAELVAAVELASPSDELRVVGKVILFCEVNESNEGRPENPNGVNPPNESGRFGGAPKMEFELRVSFIRAASSSICLFMHEHLHVHRSSGPMARSAVVN